MQRTGSKDSQTGKKDASLLIIPAIDLKEGRCVRLWRGIKDKETVYTQDPLQVARKWVREGAKRLHIVDLDGAFTGFPRHLELVKKIKSFADVPVQYGGGIRRLETIEEAVKKGIDFIIIGTKALSLNFIQKAVNKFGGKIIVSIDSREGKVAVKGWKVKTSIEAKKFIKELVSLGVENFILTDITRDGTLRGVNTRFIQQFDDQDIRGNLIIAGGVHTIEDIKKIKALRNEKIKGIIIGKALYEKTLKLKEAIQIVEEN